MCAPSAASLPSIWWSSASLIDPWKKQKKRPEFPGAFLGVLHKIYFPSQNKKKTAFGPRLKEYCDKKEGFYL